MVINIYGENGVGRTKVVFNLHDDGTVKSIATGRVVAVERSIQFYVDDYVAEQIDKCELYMDGFTPKLRLKEGETLEIPTEVEEKEREIKELEQRLRQLRGDDDE